MVTVLGALAAAAASAAAPAYAPHLGQTISRVTVNATAKVFSFARLSEPLTLLLIGSALLGVSSLAARYSRHKFRN